MSKKTSYRKSKTEAQLWRIFSVTLKNKFVFLHVLRAFVTPARRTHYDYNCYSQKNTLCYLFKRFTTYHTGFSNTLLQLFYRLAYQRRAPATVKGHERRATTTITPLPFVFCIVVRRRIIALILRRRQAAHTTGITT